MRRLTYRMGFGCWLGLVTLLWAVYPFRPRDGFVIALLLTLYPLTRFLEEVIRSDEPGRFGTGLTIAQLVSLGLAVAVIPLWIYLWRQPATLALPPATSTTATFAMGTGTFFRAPNTSRFSMG